MSAELLQLFKLIPDIGVLVLIWLVQLVIYPSFKYYNPTHLKRWHHSYTKRITFIVLPLMLSQLILSIALLFTTAWAITHIFDFVLVLLTWILTFAIFVPLHQNIDKKEDASLSIIKLIKYNWIRTFIWSVIAILSLGNVLV